MTSPHSHRRPGPLRRDLLATTALTLAFAVLGTSAAQAQAYSAGGGTTSGTGAGPVAIGQGATAQSATTRQGIINYRDNAGAGNAAAGTGADGDTAAGSNPTNTTPPNEASPDGAQPSGTAVGMNSQVGSGGGVAIGYNNRAGTAGDAPRNSTAVGSNNTANGSYSVSMGYGNAADGRSTLSLGTNNQATGDIAIALGRQSYALGAYSIAQGFVASAYGRDALAFGRLSVAGAANGTETGNVAIGDNTHAVGGSALALGSRARAENARSVAVGAGSTALRGSVSGNEAFSGTALGANTAEFSVGSENAERQVTNVAGGTRDTDAVNVRQLRGLGGTLAGTLGGSFNPTTNAYTAPQYGYGGRTYGTVPDLVGAIDDYGLRYDRDGAGNRAAGIDLTRGGAVGSAVSITGLAPATVDSGAVALGQMPLRYATSSGAASPATASNDATLVGADASRPVALHNLAAGRLASGSTDAVNGGQLYDTNQSVAALQNGTAGLVRQDAASRALTVGAATDGRLVDLTGTQGQRRLTGLLAGTGESDAVTLGQLRLSGDALTAGLGGGAAYNPATGAFTAPSYGVGGRTYRDVGSALAATNSLAVQYVPDANGAPTGTVDLARGGQTPASLRGVAAGRLAADSTEAVNGGQLFQTNQQVASNTTRLTAAETDLGDLRQGVTSGTIGLVQQNATSRALTVGAATDGALVDFTNGSGTARRLTGVAAGRVAANSLDAINGGQFYDLSQRVDAGDSSTRNLQDAIDAGTVGLVRQDPVSRDITVGANTDGTRLSLLNASRGTRVLSGLGDGLVARGSTEAVTGSQLFETNERAAATGADLADLRLGVQRGTVGLLRQDQTTGALGIASASGGTSLDLTNNAGQARTLRGVAAGRLAAGSTEAVNGGQLYETNVAVANLSGALANGTVGLVQQDPTTRAITVGGATDGTSVAFADRDGAARTLTGVAAGRIAAGSTQAVNGGQVYALTGSIAGALGGGAGVGSDGSLTAPSYAIQGGTFSTVGDALGSLDAAVASLNTNGSRYVAVRSSGPAAQALGEDTAAVGPGAVARADRGVALGAGSIADRAGLNGAREAFSNVAVTSGQGAISVGDAGGERQITNVAGGTQDTDAVNLRQLRAVGTNLAGALGGGAGFAADGTFTAPSYTLGGRQYGSVGAALGAVDTFGVTYDVDPASGGRGQSVTLAGGDPSQPVLIRNVAAGKLPTDAANAGQVAQARADAFAYTDRSVATSYKAGTAYTDAAVAPLQKQMQTFGGQLADLNHQVGEVRSEARRGAAIGLAAGSLRFDDRPGKVSVAAGGGAWRGEAAASFGIGYTLPDGSARVNATGVTAGRDFGIGAGASFTLN